jgi:AraC family transcriptional regulator
MNAKEDFEEILFAQRLCDLVVKLHSDRRLERAWQLIETGFSDRRMSLDEAGRGSGTAKNHLNVLLRRTTTFTFYQLLTRYRLYAAILMMKSTERNLLDIALDNGFGSLTTFERNFRSVIGGTPQNFKKTFAI